MRTAAILITTALTGLAMAGSAPAAAGSGPAAATTRPGTTGSGPAAAAAAAADRATVAPDPGSGPDGPTDLSLLAPAPGGAGAGAGAGGGAAKRISLDELIATVVDLPEWGTPSTDVPDLMPTCPTTGAVLHREQGDMQEIFVGQLSYGDVDRDRVEEAVALLICPVYQAARMQVVAFDRNATGKIVVLGQVVRQGVGSGTIKHIPDFTITRSGSVVARVGDLQPCCGMPHNMVEFQYRWYTWNGQAFRQTAGPTEFHPVPAEYGRPTVTVTQLSFGPVRSGKRQGSFTATITNPGPAEAPGVWLKIDFIDAGWNPLPAPVRITAEGGTCATGETRDTPAAMICHYPALAAGASRTVRITVTSPVANDPRIPGGQARVSTAAEQPGIRVLPNDGNEGATAFASLSIAS